MKGKRTWLLLLAATELLAISGRSLIMRPSLLFLSSSKASSSSVPRSKPKALPGYHCQRRRCTALARDGDGEVLRLKDQSNFAPYSALMFAAGASLGPALDGVGHGNFGVLAYHTPPPVPISIAGVKLFSTAAWVPPLFGFAGFLIGALYWLLDDYFETPSKERSPSGLLTLAAVVSFAGNYIASGFLWSSGLGAGPLAFVLAAWGVFQWRVFDATNTGLVVSAMTAVGGPLIEIFLVNAPWWDVYAYAQADFWGVDSWIPWVYLCGAPAVGCVARLVRRRLSS